MLEVNRARLLSVVNGDWTPYAGTPNMRPQIIPENGFAPLGRFFTLLFHRAPRVQLFERRQIDLGLLRHDIHVLLHATRSDAPDSVTLEEK